MLYTINNQPWNTTYYCFLSCFTFTLSLIMPHFTFDREMYHQIDSEVMGPPLGQTPAGNILLSQHKNRLKNDF